MVQQKISIQQDLQEIKDFLTYVLCYSSISLYLTHLSLIVAIFCYSLLHLPRLICYSNLAYFSLACLCLTLICHSLATHRHINNTSYHSVICCLHIPLCVFQISVVYFTYLFPLSLIHHVLHLLFACLTCYSLVTHLSLNCHSLSLAFHESVTHLSLTCHTSVNHLLLICHSPVTLLLLICHSPVTLLFLICHSPVTLFSLTCRAPVTQPPTSHFFLFKV